RRADAQPLQFGRAQPGNDHRGDDQFGGAADELDTGGDVAGVPGQEGAVRGTRSEDGHGGAGGQSDGSGRGPHRQRSGGVSSIWRSVHRGGFRHGHHLRRDFGEVRIRRWGDCAGARNFVGGAVYESGALAARGNQGSRQGDRHEHRDAHAGRFVLRLGGFGGRDAGAHQGGAKGGGGRGGHGRPGAAGGARVETHPACRGVFDADGFAADLGEESAPRGTWETRG